MGGHGPPASGIAGNVYAPPFAVHRAPLERRSPPFEKCWTPGRACISGVTWYKIWEFISSKSNGWCTCRNKLSFFVCHKDQACAQSNCRISFSLQRYNNYRQLQKTPKGGRTLASCSPGVAFAIPYHSMTTILKYSSMLCAYCRTLRIFSAVGSWAHPLGLFCCCIEWKHAVYEIRCGLLALWLF